MPNQKQTTDILREHQRGEADHSTWIYERFIARAREEARNRLSPAVKVRVRPSELADTALRQALERSMSNPDWVDSSDQFEKHLVDIVKKRCVDAVRRSKSAKRSVKREGPSTTEGDDFLVGRELAPAAQVEFNELAVLTVECLLKEDDEVDRLINILGVLCDYKAALIRQMLLTAFPEKDVPSTRTIQLRLKDIRVRVPLVLRARFADPREET